MKNENTNLGNTNFDNLNGKISNWAKKNPVKYIVILLFLVISIVYVFAYKSRIDGTKVVGTYTNYTSKNIGGFNISALTELTLKRIEDGNYKYYVKLTIKDEMYGGFPKEDYFYGSLNCEKIENLEWKFVGGAYGESNAYIIIPESGWNTPPENITVVMGFNHGNELLFKRVNEIEKIASIAPSKIQKKSSETHKRIEDFNGDWKSSAIDGTLSISKEKTSYFGGPFSEEITTKIVGNEMELYFENIEGSISYNEATQGTNKLNCKKLIGKCYSDGIYLVLEGYGDECGELPKGKFNLEKVEY